MELELTFTREQIEFMQWVSGASREDLSAWIQDIYLRQDIKQSMAWYAFERARQEGKVKGPLIRDGKESILQAGVAEADSRNQVSA